VVAMGILDLLVSRLDYHSSACLESIMQIEKLTEFDVTSHLLSNSNALKWWAQYN